MRELENFLAALLRVKKVPTGADTSVCCDAPHIVTMRYPQPPVLYISLSVVARSSFFIFGEPLSPRTFFCRFQMFCRCNHSCSNWYESSRKRPVHSASNTLRPLQKKMSALRKVVNLHIRFVIFYWTSISITARVTSPHKNIAISGRRIRCSQTTHPLLRKQIGKALIKLVLHDRRRWNRYTAETSVANYQRKLRDFTEE